MDLITNNWPTILTVLTTLAGFFGVFKYVQKFIKIITEFMDVTEVVGSFFKKVELYGEDRKFTQEEVDSLIAETNRFKKEWKEVIAAIKNLFVKEQ